MSLTKFENFSPIIKALLAAIALLVAFLVGKYTTANECERHEKVIKSLESGKLNGCIPAESLASDEATALYLEEICHFTNRLNAGITAANVENTIRIHEDDADELRSNFTTSTGQTTAVVFSIPELFKVLMQATNVNRISDDAIRLENIGLGIVFGTYPPDPPVYVPTDVPYSPGSNTCYVEFVKLDPALTSAADGNFYYESVKADFNSNLEPILYNFPRLCPTYCPPSTQ